MDGDSELNKTELDFFLKGNTSLEQVSRSNPYKWLSNNGWKDMQRLVTIGESFKQIIDDVE
jgi:dynein heavy chain